MTETRICFIDTETTSLRPDRRAWEIGIIAREPSGAEVEHRWYIDVDDLDLGNADVMSLKIGRFYERHPQHRLDRAPVFGETDGEVETLRTVEAITRGAHLVGAVVSFDADVLGQRMRANGICPSWHYHVVDVEALASGWCFASAEQLEQLGSFEQAAALRTVARPPWNSDALSRAVGVEVSDEDRHTALGDAKWARAIYDAVMGGGEPHGDDR